MGSCFTTTTDDLKRGTRSKDSDVVPEQTHQDTGEQQDTANALVKQEPAQNSPVIPLAGIAPKTNDGAPSSSSSSAQPGKDIASAAVSITPSASSSGAPAPPKEPLSPKSAIAERRGFKPESLAKPRKGQGLTIDTTLGKSTKRERKQIKVVESVSDYYRLGEEVMPSSHSGMSVLFSRRLKDDLDVVIKVRAKVNSFCDRAEEKEWRDSTEFMLNIPETEGIAKLYEVLEDRKGYYVVMEKVQGQDLFETMTGNGLLPVAEVKEVLRQLLQALADLHGRNLIHKDLKLENVMFDRSPPPNAKVNWDQFDSGQHSPVQVKIIDFDTVEHARPDTPKKKAKDVLGTDQYIAQEAYAGQYSAASDVFAAGVIGYRLLTSKFPFKSEIFNDDAGDNWVGSPKMKEIRDKLRKYQINWDHRVFTVEPHAKDLMSSMLAVSGSQRPTAKAALEHPWLDAAGRRKSVPAIGGENSARATSDNGHILKAVSEVLPHCVNNQSSRPGEETLS